ncbi:hypothetical protein [Mycobacteroides abscessus]|uniref:hypothetical protein n=1 Tax=Mycobacteroides abscessus TaxID=36809 RepID=UPI0009D042D5|nr:hypothetical protein [Mycobacteroides abscessus]SLH42745.1 Uncharacterised protein [Mycobacteroides abscessus subsp. massiliense]
MNRTLLITMMLLIGGMLSAAGTMLSATHGFGAAGLAFSGGVLYAFGTGCALRELR